jgi:hypothetical protein
VARKKQLEIFFIFYLTSLAGFIVLTLEKNKSSAQIYRQQERFLRAFLKPPDIRFDSDTVFWYVAGSDSGEIRESSLPFKAQMYLTDFNVEDSLQVKPYALHFGNTYISPSEITIGERKAYGAFSDLRVSFPIEASLKRVGTYSLDVEVHASYLHRVSPSEIRFHDRTFPSDILESEALENLQTQRKRLTIIVEDTSRQHAKFAKHLVLNCERSIVSSALGFEDSNRVSTNLDYLEPTFRIVKGSGRMEKRTSNLNTTAYIWIGQVKYQTDTICIEARLHREAGGSDIARSSFVVRGETPLLQHSIPDVCFAGEGLRADLRVNGLSDPASYSYSLSILRADGEQIISRGNKGPAINMLVNSENIDKVLRIRAYYNGRPYRFVSPTSLSGGSSQFDIPIKTPPYHIEFNPPQRVGTSYLYEFRIYRYNDAKYKELVTIADPRSIQFEMVKISGERIRLVAEALRSGYLRYRIASPQQVQPKGEEVAIEIKTPQTSIRKKLFVHRESY